MPTRMMVIAAAAALSVAACGGDDGEADSTGVATVAVTAGVVPTNASVTTESATTEPVTSEPVTTQRTTSEPVTTEPAAAFPRTITHAMGTTEITSEPQRVVTLDMSFVDATLALQTPIVGYVLYQDPDGSLPSYFGNALTTLAADAVYLGDLLEPNLEQIAAAQPDLILTSKVRHEAIYEQLSAIAPTIMSESAGAGWKDNIRLSAEALGKESVADEVIGAYEDRAAEIGAAINAAADDPVISVMRIAAQDVFRLYQRASFIGVVLDDAGLARPANQQATDPAQFITEVSFENLADADAGADRLFYTIFGNEDPADDQANAGRDLLESNPLWSMLPTVQAGTATEMSDETWMSAVGLFGAGAVLDDLAVAFGVDAARE